MRSDETTTGLLSGIWKRALSKFRAHRFWGAGTQTPEPKPRVLALLNPGSDQEELIAALCELGWTEPEFKSPECDVGENRIVGFPLVVCEKSQLQVDWQTKVRCFANGASHPMVLLISTANDQNLWDELTHCGGYAVLRGPLQRSEVSKTLKTAWSLWRSQDRLRKLAVLPAPRYS